MSLSAETTKWLDDLKKEGNLSDEAFNAIKAGVEGSPKADEFVKGSSLRQSDYSRQMGTVQQAQKDVEAAQRELQTKEAEVLAYKGTLDGWKVGADDKLKKFVSDAEAASNKALTAVNRLKSIAIANGLDENEILKDLDVPSNSQNQNTGGSPGLDTSKFLTSDQLKDQVRQASREAAMIDATIYDISTEHQKLFGTVLPSAATLVEGAIKAGKTLKQHWEESFKVPEKRTEVSENDIKARIEQGIKDGMATQLSNQVLAGQHPAGIPNGAIAPVFKNPDITKALPADHQNGGGVSAAIAAHAAGKYRS